MTHYSSDPELMIQTMIEEILVREGGFVDDPDDSGGATNMGISLKYARGIGLDLDGDGDTDIDDILLVTKEKASELFKKDFYYQPKINLLPGDLQAHVFDISVNHGGPVAIMLFQRALNCFLKLEDRIIEDSRFGPKSRKACEKILETSPIKDINNALVDLRKAFYNRVVTHTPSKRKFYKGWIKRAQEFILE